MDKQHLKGAPDKAKGAVKDVACKMTGGKQMQAEDKLDKRRRPQVALGNGSEC